MKLRLDLRLSQKLIMTPQLQQAIKLLQLSRLELQQTLTQHLMENPLLEETQAEAEEVEQTAEEKELEPEREAASSDETREAEEPPGPDNERSEEDLSPTNWEDYFDSDQRVGDRERPGADQDEFPSYDQTMTKPTTLSEHLLWQLGLSSLRESEKAIGRIIIGNLDDDGYLRTPLVDLAGDAGVPIEQVESVLQDIQSFDPAGVAARDLRECLLIQLGYLDRNLKAAANGKSGSLRGSLVELIASQHLGDLEKRQYEKIAKALGTTVEAVVKAVKVIEGLEPKPARPFFSSENYVIVPDVFVTKHEGEWVVYLNDEGIPRLRISSYYKQLVGKSSEDGTGMTKAYLEEKFRGAQWIIRSIEQRNRTILKVVKSIVKFQEAFFEQGVQHLRPLVLKQVAEDIGMHESTISRVTANKYMYCPQGMLELKFFFNTGIQRADQSEEMLSSVTVREMIRKMVAEEDARRPLKDQEIAARLQKSNIMIARRTVAKYRAEENIPSASQRKRYV